MIEIILCGCNGAMGRAITEVVLEDYGDMKIVAGVDSNDSIDNNYPVYKSILDFKGNADVIIDFSNPQLLDSILIYSKENNIPAVIASTGFSDMQLESIENSSKFVPIFFSRNMSLGINVMLELVKTATNVLPGFDIEIIEKHHNKKIDSPSGTAFMIANQINEERDNSMEYIYGREGNNTKRKINEIGIHAIRGGTIVGEHSVIYSGTDEIIEITHKAMSKKVFATGSLQAAKFLVGKKPALYSMDDLFTIKLND